jgi:hypothetical protein
MLRYLLLGYIILYVFLGVGLFALHAFYVPKEDKKDEPVWETPLDLLLVAIGLAGMVFLFSEFRPYWLPIVWRPVSVLLLVTQVWLNLKGRYEYADEDKQARTAADIFTLSFLAPSLVLNLIYAFR